MLQLALLALLASFICYFVQWTFGQPMIDHWGCHNGHYHRCRHGGHLHR